MKKKWPALPTNIQQKKIDAEKFIALAKKVKQSFEKQKEWLEQNKQEYPDNYSPELL